MVDSWDTNDEAAWQKTLRKGKAKISTKTVGQSKKSASIDKMYKQSEREYPASQEVILQTPRPDPLSQSIQSKESATIDESEKQMEKGQPTNDDVIFKTLRPDTLSQIAKHLNWNPLTSTSPAKLLSELETDERLRWLDGHPSRSGTTHFMGWNSDFFLLLWQYEKLPSNRCRPKRATRNHRQDFDESGRNRGSSRQ